MKVRKLSLVMIGIFMVLLSSICVSASTLTEGTGDVYHWTQTGSTWGMQYNLVDKPNIDITGLSATINGEQLTLVLTVQGTIQDSDKFVYWAFYNTTDMTYLIGWVNGQGSAFGYDSSGESYIYNVGEIVASGGTITATFNITGATTEESLYGYASEYTTSIDDTANEWWGDWIPNDDSPYKDTSGTDDTDNTDDNQNGDSGTKSPGFEIPLVLTALIVALIMIRRKK